MKEINCFPLEISGVLMETESKPRIKEGEILVADKDMEMLPTQSAKMKQFHSVLVRGNLPGAVIINYGLDTRFSLSLRSKLAQLGINIEDLKLTSSFPYKLEVTLKNYNTTTVSVEEGEKIEIGRPFIRHKSPIT